MKEQEIDKLFKDKLKDFSPPPSPNVWEGIQGSMAHKKGRRKILFMQVAGVAAALAIGIITVVLLNDNGNIQPVITENNPIEDRQNISQEPVEKQKEIQNNIREVEEQRERLMAASTYENTFIATKLPEANNQPIETGKTVRQAAPIMAYEYLKTKIASLLPVESHMEALKAMQKNKTEIGLTDAERELIAMNAMNLKQGNEESRWGVGLHVSPEYSSHSASHTNSYTQEMTRQTSSGSAKVGGGFSVKYKANKKWSFESGVYYSQNGQKSSNASRVLPSAAPEAYDNSISNTPVSLSQGNLLMNSTAGVIQINNTPSDVRLYANLAAPDEKAVVLLSSGEYYQVFDFVEVPLYVRYNLIESDFNIQLMGGVSTNFVVGNNVFLDDNGSSQKVGKTQNISSANYSGTIGFGIEYALGKNISLSVEPRFNYFLSSINNSPDVNFRPYRIGILTGVNYKF